MLTFERFRCGLAVVLAVVLKHGNDSRSEPPIYFNQTVIRMAAHCNKGK